MKPIPTVLLATLILSLISGCGGDHAAKQDDHRSRSDDKEPAHIDDAYYTGTGENGPNSRKDVIVSGSFFKTTCNSDVSDCQTRLPDHPEPSKTNWQNCVEIKKRMGIEYVVVADHSAAYDKVEVHVRGEDGGFSNAILIRK